MGDENHSPWYYYILPVEKLKNFTSEQYEVVILDEMFISEEDIEQLSNMEETEDEEEVGIINEDMAARFLWFKWKSKVPRGHVYVYDEVEQKYLPVPNVKVTVTQWCFTHSAYTNDNGYYDLDVTYTTLLQDNALVTVWFENKNEDILSFPFISTGFYSQGHISIGKLGSNDIYLTKDTNAQKYGNIIRAAELYRIYARKNGVMNPGKLRICGVLNSSRGAALMGNSLGKIILNSAITNANIDKEFIKTSLLNIFSNTDGLIPDIIIGCKKQKSITSTEVIFQNVFHEMAHASHFTGLDSDAAVYWSIEYVDMIFGWIEVIFNGGDPFESNNCYNNGKSKRVSFIESWGYFFGDYLMKEHYGNLSVIYYEGLLNGNSKPEFSFFYNQAYYYLKDIKQYTIKDIFDIYKKSYITNAKSFLDEFAIIHNLNSTQKQELITVFKNKGAKL